MDGRKENIMKYKFATLILVTLFVILTLACNSAGPLSGFLATPTSTVTSTPSATPTITPSQTPTASPTPLPTGVVIDKLNNGETRIVDYDMGYYLVFNEDWIPIKDDGDSIKEAMEAAGKENPELKDTIKQLDLILQDDALRLLAFNANKKYRSGSFFTNLVVISMEDNLLQALPLDLFIELNVEEIERGGSNAKVIQSGVAENKNMVAYGYIMLDNSSIQNGKTVRVRQFIIVIKFEAAMNVFTLTIPHTDEENAEELYKDFLDSLFLLEGSTILTYFPRVGSYPA